MDAVKDMALQFHVAIGAPCYCYDDRTREYLLLERGNFVTTRLNLLDMLPGHV